VGPVQNWTEDFMLTIAGGILIAAAAIFLAPYIMIAIFWVITTPFFIPGLIKRAFRGNPHKI
jgi:hypothetical protein